MPLGPKITDGVRRIIAKVYKEHKDWVAKQVMTEVHARLRRDNPQVKPNWPGITAIQIELKKIRNHQESPFDELWSLGSLVEHPIPSEAMPAVMSAYKKTLAGNGELTIREAEWIARLHKIVDPPDLVWDWAWAYAMEEWISKVTKKPFDSTKLDLEMVRNPHYAQERRSEHVRDLAIFTIAEKYGADANALKELNLSLEQTEEIAKSGKYQKEAQNERSHS